ncbi:MAG: ester cyclase [Mucilaginibacter sp.]|jgi:predicted ester cyclase|uniref:ester cyclase n=1 Tax=Mucilaginibacter sp. TaxID=1882438 RepID=UPI0035642F22
MSTIEEKSAIEKNKQVVIRFNEEFFGKGNTDITKELLAENFYNHSAPPNAPTDASPMVKFVTGFYSGFSDISVQIQDIFGEDDRVCVRKTLTATHSGEFMGKPATGKKLVTTIFDIEVLKDGKITERWNSTDFPQVFQGL